MQAMRAVLCVLALVVLAVSGCAGKGSDSTSTSAGTTACTGCTKAPTHTTTSTTSLPPNVPPTLRINITSGGKGAHIVSAPANVTVDASGSQDADGDGLAYIAVALRDANGTLPARLLYSNGRFTAANFTLVHPGPVNVTVVGIDKRNGATNWFDTVYVDARLAMTTAKFTGAVPGQAADPTTCKGPAGAAAVDAQVWQRLDVDVGNGTQGLAATVTAGAATLALCDPSGHAISDKSATTARSKPGTVFSVPTGTQHYFVSVLSALPNQAVGVRVEVLYEPVVAA